MVEADGYAEVLEEGGEDGGGVLGEGWDLLGGEIRG